VTDQQLLFVFKDCLDGPPHFVNRGASAVAEDDEEPARWANLWIDEELECMWVLNGVVVVRDPREKPVTDFEIISAAPTIEKLCGKRIW
jgi:hypothetical protein